MKHHILKDYEMAARFVAGMSTKPQPPQPLSHIGKEWFRKRFTQIHSALQISLHVQQNADIYQNYTNFKGANWDIGN